MANEAGKQTKGDEVDLFRDTPVRYLGYANELGEAFRPILPKFLVPSYFVSFGYVFADTFELTLNPMLFVGFELEVFN